MTRDADTLRSLLRDLRTVEIRYRLESREHITLEVAHPLGRDVDSDVRAKLREIADICSVGIAEAQERIDDIEQKWDAA